MLRLLFILASLVLASAAAAANFTYSLTGQTSVFSAENAVGRTTIDTSAEVFINEDGAVFGVGTLTYLRMDACAWEPPAPEGQAGFCRTESVTDASFTIEGQVVEMVSRTDTNNPYLDEFFAFSEPRADRATDSVPSKVSIRLTVDGELSENLAFWGFSNGGIQRSSTGMAFLGVLVSGLFDQQFELSVLDAFDAGFDAPDSALHRFAGEYEGGTLISSEGLIGFSSFPRDLLPSVTDPWVYLGHWASGPGETPVPRDDLLAQRVEDLENALTDEELADFTSTVSQPDSREAERDEIRGNMAWVTVEAIRQEMGWPPAEPWAYDPPANPYPDFGAE